MILQELFDYGPEALFVTDGEGVLLHRSAEVARVLGAEVPGGAKLRDFMHPDDRGAFDGCWARIREGLDPVRFELRLRGEGGVYRAWSCSARQAPASGNVHGVLREPAAPAGSEVERQAEVLTALVATLPVAVWAMDADGICTLHEGKALEHIGLQRGQFVGQNLIDKFTNENFVVPVGQALAGEVAHFFSEYDGVSWESWHVPLFDARGAVRSIAAISLDISAAKAAEQELRAHLDLIEQQRQAIRELSTPVIEVWDRVLTLPMVGLVDSGRAAEVMDALLDRVSRTNARFAILDLTGVDAVDSGTASHLISMISAIRLLGAEGVITGIRSSVAQTMVQLGLDLQSIVTLAKLRDGLVHCIRRMTAERA